MKMVNIRDTLVGDITPTEAELRLIDTKRMQRLRNIKQLGLAYLVYPGANHTRFEHSLGTMQLTREIVQNATGEKDEELECAGLLHDIGHGPFSHYSDSSYKKYLNTTHEEIGEGIVRGELGDVISKEGLSKEKVLKYFLGKGRGAIVTGTLGSDRLDYLSRDAHYTGAVYGTVDYLRIKSKLTLYKDRPAVHENGVSAAESVLIARYLMFTSVYLHHATIIAEMMFENAIDAAIKSKALDPKDLKELNDFEMVTTLRGSKGAGAKLMGRLLERRLYKRAYYGRVEGNVNVEEISKAIEKKGIPKESYVIKHIKFKGGEDDIDVVDRNGSFVGKLTEISPLVGTLSDVLSNRSRLLVACDAKDVKSVGTIVEKSL